MSSLGAETTRGLLFFARFVVVPTILVLTLAIVPACDRPVPPPLEPRQASITQVTMPGLKLSLRMQITNPNAVSFGVQSIRAKVRLDNRFDLGPVVVPHAVTLPAGQPVSIDIPLSLDWGDLAALGLLAQANRDVDYEVDGTVALGPEKVNFDLPVRWHGLVRREDLVAAAVRSLPGLLNR